MNQTEYQPMRYNDYEVGASIPELHVGEITQATLARYAGASGDFNAIHVDPDFARTVGLQNTIAHGMFIKAQLSRLATNWIAPQKIVSLHTKFKNMTLVGEKIICKGYIKKKKENESGKFLIVTLEAVNEATNSTPTEVKALSELIIRCE